MRHDPHARSVLRRAQFERYEDRLVFSSVLWTDVCAEQTPDLVSTLPDRVELALAMESSGAITPASAPLNYVRNTYGFQGEGQTVAIIDTGIAWDHVALGGGLGEGYRVVGGWDFTEENDANPYDDGPRGFHGTHVAGIVGAQDDTYFGVAPGADLVGLRVFNDQGYGHTTWVEQALSWVHDHKDDFRFPITTINMSLGAQWNGEAPPSWATLEDEFAQLARDGIFVSVAAGNSFTRYGEPGLAYPAASPHVVPVSSVGADGQLSDFSQRHSRVLAAPGESITSTIPDHIYGVDGAPNDWAAASGTSMAAPYLAGASVLVREAMQFVGYTFISQSDIYDHLSQTSDQVFDSQTGAYYERLNLPRAIESLLPADDYSSDLDRPFDLGVVQGTRSLSGQLARLDDQDVFQFTAMLSGELSWEAAGCHSFDVAMVSESGQLALQATGSSLRVEAGTTYTFVISACDRLTDYDIELSIEADSLVTVTGNVVRVNGTAGNDTIHFTIDDAYRLEVNGQEYSFARDVAWQFEFTGGGGTDRLLLAGSEQRDTVILRAGSADMSGYGYDLMADGFYEITAIAGEGVGDTSRLFGGTGNDQFTASPTSATMLGAGYINRVAGFERVYGYAMGGDNDIARLYDSSGNDIFVGQSTNGTMSGSGYFIKAWNFDRVYAHASTGRDIARLFDSRHNDVFLGARTAASMQGHSFFNEARHFDQVYAYAIAGGHDIARLYDSPRRDLFTGTQRAGWMQGNSIPYRVWNFDRVYTYASVGANDVASVYGPVGNASARARATNSNVPGASYFKKAEDDQPAVRFGRPGAERPSFDPDNNPINHHASRSVADLVGYDVWNPRAEPAALRNPVLSHDSNLRSAFLKSRELPVQRSDCDCAQIDHAVAMAAVACHDVKTPDYVPADADNGLLGEVYLAALDDLFQSLERE